jgi:predicted nucleic acid-binding protein
MNFFFDSSSLFKLYHTERGTQFLEDLLRQNSPNVFVTISDLARIEFRSALQRRVRLKEITMGRAKELFFQFENDFSLYNIAEVESGIKNLSVQLLETIGARKPLKTLDAIQLATAIGSHQSFTIDSFVASDSNLLNIASEFFSTINPISSI